MTPEQAEDELSGLEDAYTILTEAEAECMDSARRTQYRDWEASEGADHLRHALEYLESKRDELQRIADSGSPWVCQCGNDCPEHRGEDCTRPATREMFSNENQAFCTLCEANTVADSPELANDFRDIPAVYMTKKKS